MVIAILLEGQLGRVCKASRGVGKPSAGAVISDLMMRI